MRQRYGFRSFKLAAIRALAEAFPGQPLLRPAIEQDAVQVLLTDHHYWGGLRRTRELAAVCEAFGIALSYPWNSADDVVLPGVLELEDGEVRVPTGPGLGVELDHDALDRLLRLPRW